MGLLKLLGQLKMMNAKTPGDLATGYFLAESENNNKRKRQQESNQVVEKTVSWSVCRNCGGIVQEGAKFCANCGIQFKGSSPKKISNETLKFNFFDENNNIIDLNNIEVFKPNFYVIGKSKIKPGNYMFFSPNGKGSYILGMGETSKNEMISQLREDKEESNGGFNNIFLTLKNGDYIYFEDGFLISTDLFYKTSFNHRDGRSEYRIGIDIPEGSYKIFPIDTNYYASIEVTIEFNQINKDVETKYFQIDDEISIDLVKGMNLITSTNCNFELMDK